METCNQKKQRIWLNLGCQNLPDASVRFWHEMVHLEKNHTEKFKAVLKSCCRIGNRQTELGGPLGYSKWTNLTE